MKKISRLIACALILVLSVFMFACTPASLDKAKEKMEKAGYEVSIVEDDKGEGIMYAYKSNEQIMAIMFADNESAKAFYNDSAKMYAFILFDKDSAVLSGRWIYAGTSQAMKDFK